jgi:hypothetical protein
MSNLNLMRPENGRHMALDDVEEPVAIMFEPASGPQGPQGAHRHRIELVVLVVGLVALTWMILMQNVRVGLPGLMMSTPVEVRAEGRDGGSSPLPARPISLETP